MAHLFCLLWLGLAYVLLDNDLVETNWILGLGIEDDYWLVHYIWSFYFAITTCTTVGYGDVTPTNVYETVVLIFGLVIASGMFAYMFNSVGILFYDLTAKQKEYKKQASLANIYLRKKNCPAILQIQVNKYLEYKYQSEKELSLDEENQIIQTLPENMQEEIKYQQAIFVIKSNSQIFGRFSDSVQQRLALKIIEKQYNKHENIFEQDETSLDPCLYFVQSGKIEMFTHSYKGDQQFTTLSILQDQQTFGEYSFITGQPRSIGAQTLKASIICILKRSDLISVVQKSIYDEEIYYMLKDKLLMDKNSLSIQLQCFACKQYGHYSHNCYLLHYICDKEKLLMKQKFVYWTPRNYTYLRDEKLKYHSLLDRSLIRDRQKDFLKELIEKQKQEQYLNKLKILMSQQTYLRTESMEQEINKLSVLSFQHNVEIITEQSGENNSSSKSLHQSDSDSSDDYFDDNTDYLIQKKIQQIDENYKKNKHTVYNEEEEYSKNSSIKSISNQKKMSTDNESLQSSKDLNKGYKTQDNNNKKQNNITPKNSHHDQNHLHQQNHNNHGHLSKFNKGKHQKQTQNQRKQSMLDIQKNNINGSNNNNILQSNKDLFETQKRPSALIISGNNNTFHKQNYLNDLVSSNINPQNQGKRIIFKDIQKSEEQVSAANIKVQLGSNQEEKNYNMQQKELISKRYSQNLSQLMQNNITQKSQDQKDLIHKIEQDLQGVYNSLANDCEIKKFKYYYPNFNFDCWKMLNQYNWAYNNLAKTPGFGIYTIKERTIRLNEYIDYNEYIQQLQKIRYEQIKQEKKNEIYQQILKKANNKKSQKIQNSIKK